MGLELGRSGWFCWSLWCARAGGSCPWVRGQQGVLPEAGGACCMTRGQQIPARQRTNAAQQPQLQRRQPAPLAAFPSSAGGIGGALSRCAHTAGTWRSSRTGSAGSTLSSCTDTAGGWLSSCARTSRPAVDARQQRRPCCRACSRASPQNTRSTRSRRAASCGLPATHCGAAIMCPLHITNAARACTAASAASAAASAAVPPVLIRRMAFATLVPTWVAAGPAPCSPACSLGCQ